MSEDRVPENLINYYASRLRILLKFHYSKPKQEPPSEAMVEEALKNERKNLEKKQTKNGQDKGKTVIAVEPLKDSNQVSSSNVIVQGILNVQVRKSLCF